jgi:hypothetical protein
MRGTDAGADLPRGGRRGQGIDLRTQPAGHAGRLGSAATARGALELGVELLDEPEAPLHLHLVERVHHQVRGAGGLPTLGGGQPSRQLGGDGHGGVEKPGRHLHVMAANRVTHLAEDLVQILTEGAEMPAGDPQLEVVVRGLAPAPVIALQGLQALGGSRSALARLKVGGDGRAD